jgi:hypothetical protein
LKEVDTVQDDSLVLKGCFKEDGSFLPFRQIYCIFEDEGCGIPFATRAYR